MPLLLCHSPSGWLVLQVVGLTAKCGESNSPAVQLQVRHSAINYVYMLLLSLRLLLLLLLLLCTLTRSPFVAGWPGSQAKTIATAVGLLCTGAEGPADLCHRGALCAAWGLPDAGRQVGAACCGGTAAGQPRVARPAEVSVGGLLHGHASYKEERHWDYMIPLLGAGLCSTWPLVQTIQTCRTQHGRHCCRCAG